MAGNGTPQRTTSGSTSNLDEVPQPTNASIPTEQIIEEARALAVVPLAVMPALVHHGGRGGLTMVRPDPQFGQPGVVTSRTPVPRHAPHHFTISKSRLGPIAHTKDHLRACHRPESWWFSSCSRMMERPGHLRLQVVNRIVLYLKIKSWCSLHLALQTGRSGRSHSIHPQDESGVIGRILRSRGLGVTMRVAMMNLPCLISQPWLESFI
jgi:hypothetical protein